MVGGEPGGGIPHIRQKIEETFGASVQECMGNRDMLGLMWAECEYKNGMHFVGQGACHPEFIDPISGEVLEVKEGFKGGLVYTSIDRECQPLIRFRTRDHVVVTHSLQKMMLKLTGIDITLFHKMRTAYPDVNKKGLTIPIGAVSKTLSSKRLSPTSFYPSSPSEELIP